MPLRIAHSNIQPAWETPVAENEPKPVSEFAMRMAKKSFQRARKKNAARIAEIQKYFPGWEPEFRYPY